MKLIEDLKASLEKYRPKQINRSKGVSLCIHDAVRLQVYNMPVRKPTTVGVRDPSKVFNRYICRTWKSYSFATAPWWQGNRKATCWSGSNKNFGKSKGHFVMRWIDYET